MALLYSAFPQQRGTAVGLFNMSVAFGLIIGRFGGVLVELFDWRMIFYMTIPFGVLSAVLGWFSFHARPNNGNGPLIPGGC